MTSCDKCATGTTCIDCDEGYFKDTSAICCKTENCNTCNVDGEKCDECASDYFLLNDGSDDKDTCVDTCPTGYCKNNYIML